MLASHEKLLLLVIIVVVENLFENGAELRM
jgi:hypothetical protein